MLRTTAWLASLWLLGLSLGGSVRACTGDCNGDGEVTIDEIVKGVNIALEALPVSACPSFDSNGNGSVTIDEVIAAVNAALAGCPTASPTAAVASATPTPTQSPTHAVPVVTPLAIYRTYPGFPIALQLPVASPDGDGLDCSATNLPSGAQFDKASQTFEWTPSDDQLGPFYVPFSCTDTASALAVGTLSLKVEALDQCGTPVCDPSTGCTKALPSLATNCCVGGAVARVAEPAADCPEGLVLFVGDNQNGGFGRLQDCDHKRVLNMAQSAAQVRFHVQTRCLSLDDRARVYAHLETGKRVLFDQEYRITLLPQDDGFDEQYGIAFPVDRLTGFPDFTDLEGAEANLTMTLIDADNVAVTDNVRLVLTFTPVPDEPDVDPTPTQAAN